MAANPALTQQAGRGNPVVTALVTRARNGDRQAWDALVDRYPRWSGPSAVGTGCGPPTPTTPPRPSGSTS